MVLRSIFHKTKTLSDQLQAKDLDLAEAVYLVDAVIADLEESRSSAEVWTTLCNDSVKKCSENGIPIKSPARRSNNRIIPVHLRDTVGMAPTGHRAEM